MPVAPVRRSTPSASQEAPHSSQPSARAYRHWKNPQPSPASEPSGLFERLQDELRKVAEAAEISEVIDERPKAPAVVPPPLPKPPATRPSGRPPSKVRSSTPSKADLDRAASLVEKATRELEVVKSQRPSRKLKTSAQRGGLVSFASTRRSLRDPSAAEASDHPPNHSGATQIVAGCVAGRIVLDRACVHDGGGFSLLVKWFLPPWSPQLLLCWAESHFLR